MFNALAGACPRGRGPFERGYGHTLGDALRRILLADARLCADGDDEACCTSTRRWTVCEDVVDILLNIKGVSSSFTISEALLTLSKKGGAW